MVGNDDIQLFSQLNQFILLCCQNWYCFSKTIAEEKALEYAGDCGLDVLTVCPALIIGPMLQPTLNSTTAYLLNILKDDEKNAHLKRLENALENLKLFKADLLDYGSLCAAVAGCEGVFHIACPCPSGKLPNPEADMVAPALDGTLNVLKACSEAKVRRVVVVSSVAAVIMNPTWPRDKVMVEDCWSDKEYCKATENWYYYSKTIAEERALEYGRESGLDVVTVLPCLIIGPMLQPTVNASSSYVITILKGLKDPIENIFIHIVDARDVAGALLLVYEKPESTGRYICCSHGIKIHDFVDKLRSMYPNLKYPKTFTEPEDDFKVSSEKLRQLGWKHMTLEASMADTVEHLVQAGFLGEE